MAMNREQKRLLQRQGEITADGSPAARGRRAPRQGAPTEARVGPRQFAREVRSELRKVAWPTRAETINYSVVVLVTLLIVTAFVFAIDWVFADLVSRLFSLS